MSTESGPPAVDPHPATADTGFLGAAALRGALEAGELTSVEAVGALLGRIEALDGEGPRLRSILALAPDALESAARLDAERRAGTSRGALHGIPVLVKDNIDTAGGLGTTAGSLALAGPGTGPGRDAPLVALLRSAGAIVLGKTNLSEWANFRSRPSSSGWSAVGGQTRNPYGLDRSPGGSSSGSAAALAAGLAPLAVGTETDGSVICPAAACGVVGLKPTVGLVSRSGIVPISATQDTAGPMARSVADVALMLDVLGSGPLDAGDPATAVPGRAAAIPAAGYLQAVSCGRPAAGLRVGVVRDDGYQGYHPGADAVVEAALPAFAEAGVEVVESVEKVGSWSQEDEMTVMCHEFKAGLGAYLAARADALDGAAGAGRLPGSLADVIAFNEATAAEALQVFNQEMMLRSLATTGLADPDYQAARERNLHGTRSGGIDAVCRRQRLDALVALTMAPAWPIDHVNGDTHTGSSWSLAAVAGYPSVTLPIGRVHGLPVGLTIFGPAWSELTLLRLAAALESELWLREAMRPGFAPAASLLA